MRLRHVIDIPWDTVAKLGPLYVSSGLLSYNELRKRWNKRRQAALGPVADQLRFALEDARRAFDDIVATPQRTPWFMAPARRELGQKLDDLSLRFSDSQLKIYVLEAIVAWNQAFANAPGVKEGKGTQDGHGDWVPAPEQIAEDQVRLARQSVIAQEGRKATESALERLNDLERKVSGTD